MDNNNKKKGEEHNHLLLHILPRESSHDLKSNDAVIQDFFFDKKRILH